MYIIYLTTCTSLHALYIVYRIQVCNEFKEMSHRLFERPNTIEELTDTREYMKTIPEVRKTCTVHIHVHKHVCIWLHMLIDVVCIAGF